MELFTRSATVDMEKVNSTWNILENQFEEFECCCVQIDIDIGCKFKEDMLVEVESFDYYSKYFIHRKLQHKILFEKQPGIKVS